ncbi:hypothetical protein HK105_208304 [Polyrhizophydium stewartii]|uniref:Major facilitator superfamily (MFS) profile domain-containing protein n=1 Tax=Polyrhizophydium stewartii TaxID=2732419 RepID=A0ABR4MY88_9FUNG|nr:hypothetical protein HK105_005959 [Polyrhizophydium stewartii]
MNPASKHGAAAAAPAPARSASHDRSKAVVVDRAFQRRTLRTVVVALLIDILAFTIILPLFPRLIAHYESVDGSNPSSTYYAAAQGVKAFRELIGGTGSRLDIILFGGFLGSMFSFLQFVSSPLIGRLSDRYGRRTVLLISMLGNGLSMLLWIFSGSFSVFVLSRVVGGLTEGNVQMSIAIISDITSAAERSRNLAWVGISFALGFTVGPPLGAYCTKFDLQEMLPSLPVNRYSSPALFAFILIVIETIYLFRYLPETSRCVLSDEVSSTAPPLKAQTSEGSRPPLRSRTAPEQSARRLAVLSLVHFVFLFAFSGMEFTLTFLTYDRFDFSHGQQGRLLAYMGVLSALIQGAYVRRVAHKHVSEQTIVLQGIVACAAGLTVIGALATSTRMLYVGATLLAFTSGTVVNCLTSLASLEHSSATLSEPEPANAAQDKSSKGHSPSGNLGHALGKFRSMGQLGRCLGPLAACSGYWIIGSTNVYLAASSVMAVLALAVVMAVPGPARAARKTKAD